MQHGPKTDISNVYNNGIQTSHSLLTEKMSIIIHKCIERW